MGSEWPHPGPNLGVGRQETRDGRTIEPVLRAALLAIVMFLSFEMSGLAAICGDPVGDADCDHSGGKCPPNCNSCSCCSVPKMDLTVCQFIMPAPAVVAHGWPAGTETPASAEPNDIFHVPKLLA